MRKKMDPKKRDMIKASILQAATKIVETEGFKGLSIRKVAAMCDYTPGSIYQYFDDKDALIKALITQGYQKIIQAVLIDVDETLPLEKQLIIRFKAYVKTALNMSQYYKAVMLSEDEKILARTAIYNETLNPDQPALNILEDMIQKGISHRLFKDQNPAFIAKTLWSAMFGLTMRLIIEKIDDETLVNSLVQKQLQIFFEGIRLKGGDPS